jgi:hypothetical protein
MWGTRVDEQPEPVTDQRKIRERLADWCAADEPDARCGTGPLARYISFGRLLVRGLVRLAQRRHG